MAISGIDAMYRKIELYKSIPIYPKTKRMPCNMLSDSSAPLCQGEHNEIAFTDADSKKNYMARLYAQRQRMEMEINAFKVGGDR